MSRHLIDQRAPRWLDQLEPLLLTAILLAYFLPWITHPAAGLTLIGLDVSEWVKFLPQMQSGELPNRDYFYLPPLFLGAAVATLSLNPDLSGWQRWLLRLTGVGVGLLAFPSIDAIRFEAASEWRPRLIWITLVAVWSLLVLPLVARLWVTLSAAQIARFKYGILLLCGAAGAILPAVVLWPTQRVAHEWLNISVGAGSGFWLSTVAFGALAAVAVLRLVQLFNRPR